MKHVLRPLGRGVVYPEKNGWILKVQKGRLVPEFDYYKVADARTPIKFQATIKNQVNGDMKWGQFHDTFELAKAEGLELLEKYA